MMAFSRHDGQLLQRWKLRSGNEQSVYKCINKCINFLICEPRLLLQHMYERSDKRERKGNKKCAAERKRECDFRWAIKLSPCP